MLRFFAIKASFLSILLGLSFSAFTQTPSLYSSPKKTTLQSPYKGLKLKYFAYQFDLTTGLNSNRVVRIDEDKYGRIWFTSDNAGFSVMDGEHLYSFGSHNGFFDRYNRLHCDLEGNVWLGGNGVGVTKLHSGYLNDRYVQIGYDISDVHIQDIKHDSKNNVWVSTRLGGITCISKDTSYLYGNERLGLSEELVRKRKYSRGMAIDNKDRIWTVVNGGILFIEDGEVYRMPPELLGNEEFFFVGGDGHNHVIGVTNNNKLYKITTDGAEKMSIPLSSKKNDRIERIRYDKNGVLYLSDNKDIFKIVDNQPQAILNPPDDFGGINEFIFDHNNSLWISTSKQGIIYIPKFNIARMTDIRINSFGNKLKLVRSDDYILNARIESNGSFLFDTLMSISKQDELKEIKYLHDGALFELNGRRYAFNHAKEPDPTLVKKFERFSRIERKGNITTLRDKEGYVFFEDEKGVIHETGFLSEVDPHFFHQEGDKYYFSVGKSKYNKSIIFVENDQTHILLDNLGGDSLQFTATLYVSPDTFICASWGLHYFKISPDGYTNFSNNLGSNILFRDDIDSHNNLWIGGLEGGINYISGRTDSSVNIKPTDGLSGSRVAGVYAFESGNVAVGTNLGLDYFILKDENTVVRTKEDFFKRYELRSYSFDDGLINQNFKNIREDEAGRLWFTSNGGIPHILSPNDTVEFKPEFLSFESIVVEDRNKENKILFEWIPGRAYKTPSKVQMNYDETLLLTLRSIFFFNPIQQNYSFKIDDGNWTKAHKSSSFRIGGLEPGEHRLEFKTILGNGQQSEIVSLEVEVSSPFYQKAWFWLVVGSAFLILIYLVFRGRTHVVRRRAKVLEQTVEERTEEIQLAKVEIETQHKEIKDSIGYAKRIQEAILPAPRLIEQMLPDSFVLYRPKDIVAGDFYWIEEVGDIILFAAADCTGHGVPGAMVSVVCHNALERAVREFDLFRPSDILNKTRELVLETFEKSESNVKDGMDISVVALNRKTLELEFAGANNPLYIIADGELTEIKGDKQPIGSFENHAAFTNHSMQIEKGTLIYSFTDGFADQFGGEKGKKFKYKPFKELLLRHCNLAMNKQQEIVENVFDEWKGELEQVDDVCIIGVRI